MVDEMSSSNWDDKKWGMTFEEFQKSIEDYANDRLWFYDNLDDLRRTHLNKWVAVRNKQIVDSDKDHDELIERLESGGIGLSGTHVLFVRPEDIVVIY